MKEDKTIVVSLIKVYSNDKSCFFVVGDAVGIGKDKQGRCFGVINGKKLYGITGAEYIGQVEMRKV